VALAAIVGVTTTILWVRRGSVRVKPDAPLPVRTSLPAVAPPTAAFVDITRESGITFSHENGATGDKLLPETMGVGVAFFDYDNDGRPDLLFVDSRPWPSAGLTNDHPPAPGSCCAKHRRGRFVDAHHGHPDSADICSMGVAAADYDNDGLDRPVLHRRRRQSSLPQCPGTLHRRHRDGRRQSRAVMNHRAPRGSTDRDGNLDLFVYLRPLVEAIDFQQDFRLVGLGRAYGPPRTFEGTFPYLYRNDGHGHFTEVAAQAGLQVTNPATHVPIAKSLGVVSFDLDEDGWPDLVVSNDTVQNFVFHNRQNGTFEEIGARAGVAFDPYGNSRSAMGIDAADFRNDGSLGIAIGNFANEMTALYVSQRNAVAVRRRRSRADIGPTSRGVGLRRALPTTTSTTADLLTANGHRRRDQQGQASQRYTAAAPF
jgi:hypothetical protein